MQKVRGQDMPEIHVWPWWLRVKGRNRPSCRNNEGNSGCHPWQLEFFEVWVRKGYWLTSPSSQALDTICTVTCGVAGRCPLCGPGNGVGSGDVQYKA